MPSEEVPTELGPKSLTAAARRLMANNFDRGENPGRKEVERAIPADLVEAYENFYNAFPVDEREEIGQGGAIGRSDILESFKADSEKGQKLAKIFLSAVKGELVEKGIENPTDETVLAETVRLFNEDAERIRAGNYTR